MISDSLSPLTSWAMMSRPLPDSTPSGCAALIPPHGKIGSPPFLGSTASWLNVYGSQPNAASTFGPMSASTM